MVLRATAGLRLLPEKKAQALLLEVVFVFYKKPIISCLVPSLISWGKGVSSAKILSRENEECSFLSITGYSQNAEIYCLRESRFLSFFSR